MGREDELLGLAQRGVTALEKLAEDPVVQLETGPPVCPFCDKMNPDVRVAESEAQGPLAEFVIRAQCLSCNNLIFGVPLHWAMGKNIEEIRAVIEERVRAGGFNGGTHQGA